MVLALWQKTSMSLTKLTVSSALDHQDTPQQVRDLMVNSQRNMVIDGVIQHMTSSVWKSEKLMSDCQSQDIRVTQNSLKDLDQEAGKPKKTGTLFEVASELTSQCAH